MLAPHYFNANVPKPEHYHPWWGKILSFYNTFKSKTTEGEFMESYEQMSEAEFNEFVSLLKEGIFQGIIQQQ